MVVNWCKSRNIGYLDLSNVSLIHYCGSLPGCCSRISFVLLTCCPAFHSTGRLKSKPQRRQGHLFSQGWKKGSCRNKRLRWAGQVGANRGEGSPHGCIVFTCVRMYVHVCVCGCSKVWRKTCGNGFSASILWVWMMEHRQQGVTARVALNFSLQRREGSF